MCSLSLNTWLHLNKKKRGTPTASKGCQSSEAQTGHQATRGGTKKRTHDLGIHGDPVRSPIGVVKFGWGTWFWMQLLMLWMLCWSWDTTDVTPSTMALWFHCIHIRWSEDVKLRGWFRILRGDGHPTIFERDYVNFNPLAAELRSWCWMNISVYHALTMAHMNPWCICIYNYNRFWSSQHHERDSL